MNTFCAEYVWVDSNGMYRSKTRNMNNDNFASKDPIVGDKSLSSSYPIWNYNGSNTNDAIWATREST